MKLIYPLRYLIMLLVLPLLLGSCSKDDEAAPSTAVQHKIQVRVTGENLSGLGAELHVKSTLNFINGPFVAGPGLHETYATSITRTYDLGTFGKEDIIEAQVMFRNVTKNGAVQPSATSRLKLELIADGVVKENTELNKSASGWKVQYNPYLVGGADLETDNLK